jgi:hypothetical protein
VGPKTWVRVLCFTPFGAGGSLEQEHYPIDEPGMFLGPKHLDLDDVRHNGVIRIMPARLDFFRRAEPRWDEVWRAVPGCLIASR